MLFRSALAGVAIGGFSSIKDTVPVMAKPRKVFTPNTDNSAEYQKLYNKYANLYNAVKGL